MSMDRKSALALVTESGLLKTQGLIGGIWMDAFDGKSIKVCAVLTNSLYLVHLLLHVFGSVS